MTQPRRWPGNIDGDGTADPSLWTGDKAVIVALNTKTIADADDNPDADLDRSGTINGADALVWSTLNGVNGAAALGSGLVSDPAGADNPFGYDGYFFSPESRLYGQRFRWYDPALGRWLQRDPAGYVDGMSLYEYAGGRPVHFLDPLGLEWFNPSNPGQRYNPSNGQIRFESFTDRIRHLIERTNGIPSAMRTADRLATHLFHQIQQRILDKIGRCVQSEADAQWLADTVQDFMEPYLNSMSERAADGNIGDEGWSNFWADVDSGLYDRDYVARSVLLSINFGLLKRRDGLGPASLWGEGWEAEDFLISETLAITRAMALNHINNDLRKSLEKNGIGTDCVWDCVGRVVEESQKEVLTPPGAFASDAAEMFAPDLDIGIVRDEMRDRIRNRQ